MCLDLAKLVVEVATALFVTVYWNKKRYKSQQFEYLDKLYNDVLIAYSEEPQFGDAEFIAKLAEASNDHVYWKYHVFAMRVHTFLESIVDVYGKKIPDEWVHIFQYHARLHSAWLQSHQELHEERYWRQFT